MQIINGLGSYTDSLSGGVVTIGNFDGVHLGHQKLIDAAKRKSIELKARCVLITFDPHPLKVLFPERGIKRIFSLEDQKLQMQKNGVDVFVIEPFSRALSEMSAEDFLKKCVLKPFAPRAVVIGYDFAFGKERQGNAEYLKKNANKFGFELIVVPAHSVNSEVCSSSEIRKKVLKGDVAGAAKMLGRNFYVEGVVGQGAHRGKSMGFPTANLVTSSELVPKPGVYVSKIEWQGREYLAATNIGINPTFETGTNVKIESHLLDYSGDLYGHKINIVFLDYIREEKKFNSVEELINQIKNDVNRVRQWDKNEHN